MIFRNCCLLLLLAFALPANAQTNVLVWNRAADRVDADVRGWPVEDLLKRVAAETGWQILLEPGINHEASVKFRNRSSGEALRSLLGDLNFALVPQTNRASRLYVFRTAMKNATQLIGSTEEIAEKETARRIANELIIRVKPGVDIEALARQLGAKIVGRIPELNAYRLRFEDEAATESARSQLASNPDVTSVQDNYYVDRPPSPQMLTGVAAPQTNLKLNPPKQEGCKVIVGLVDTAVQPLGADLEKFIKARVAIDGEPMMDPSSPMHGTAMAQSLLQGVQAAQKGGTSVQLLSVDVFGAGRSANTFNVAAGLIKAGNSGATVINASLGGYGDSLLLRDAVQQLYDNNIPVFAAVGNDASASPFFPAAYPQVISVTALERGRVASYANTGTAADAAAPGTALFSFNNQTYVTQGTSVSSAVATGVAAGIADSTCAPWTQVIPTVRKNLAVPGTQP